jgi:COMPASS (Complex proteins associated with Set1p) component shg1
MIDAIQQCAEGEIERKSELLSKDRRIAAALIEGAAERTDIYKIVGACVDDMVATLLGEAEVNMRAIRAKDIGEEAAADEHVRGGKTDDQYIREAEERKAGRYQKREEAKEKIRQKEREAKRVAEEERRRKKEEDAARDKERADREEKRRKEREDQERERQEAFDREREERRERRRREEERFRDESYARERDRDTRKRERQDAEPSSGAPLVTEKDLEEAALEELLREGQMAAKSRNRPALETDDALEPPPRKVLPPKSIVPRDPATARLSKTVVQSPKPEVKELGDVLLSAAAKPKKEVQEPEKSRISVLVPGSATSRDDNRREFVQVEDDRRSSRQEPGRDNNDRYQGDRHASGYDNYRPGGSYRDAPRSYDRYTGSGGDRRRDDEAAPRRRSRSRSKSRSRSRPRGDHYRAQRRSRSPSRRRSYRERSRTPPRRNRDKGTRDKSPEHIDRYMPSTSSRRPRDDRPRDDRARADRPRDDRDRDRDRNHDRDHDRNRDRDRDRDRGGERHARDIDRYVPGQTKSEDADGKGKDRGRASERSRSRSRDRGRNKREKEGRYRSGSREGRRTSGLERSKDDKLA